MSVLLYKSVKGECGRFFLCLSLFSFFSSPYIYVFFFNSRASNWNPSARFPAFKSPGQIIPYEKRSPWDGAMWCESQKSECLHKFPDQLLLLLWMPMSLFFSLSLLFSFVLFSLTHIDIHNTAHTHPREEGERDVVNHRGRWMHLASASRCCWPSDLTVFFSTKCKIIFVKTKNKREEEEEDVIYL